MNKKIYVIKPNTLYNAVFERTLDYKGSKIKVSIDNTGVYTDDKEFVLFLSSVSHGFLSISEASVPMVMFLSKRLELDPNESRKPVIEGYTIGGILDDLIKSNPINKETSFKEEDLDSISKNLSILSEDQLYSLKTKVGSIYTILNPSPKTHTKESGTAEGKSTIDPIAKNNDIPKNGKSK